MARAKDEKKQKISFSLRESIIARIDQDAGLMGVDRGAWLQFTLTSYFAGKDGLEAIQWAQKQKEEALKE